MVRNTGAFVTHHFETHLTRRDIVQTMITQTRLFLLILAFMILNICITISQAAESGSFSGSWSANGTKETMSFGHGREVAIFEISGHVNLKTELGKRKDYWSDCFGLTETGYRTEARCTWQSLDGQKIFLRLTADSLREGATFTGEIIGGTGGAEGITGRLELEWEAMIIQRDGAVTKIGGYAKELSGTYNMP